MRLVIVKLIEIFYRFILKPILFFFPADIVHEKFLELGNFIGKYEKIRKIVAAVFYYENRGLEQTVAGIKFMNPVGLSAGFDYKIDLINILPSLGFGFETVGTITNEEYEGNPRPRLGRLPKSKALLVNKGFKNEGIDKSLEKLDKFYKQDFPVGLSIGSTNKKFNTYSEVVNDIYTAFEKSQSEANFDFYELNVSCPNLINMDSLEYSASSEQGLKIILDKLRQLSLTKPVFIKMPLEKSDIEIEKMVEVAIPYNFVVGLIFSNLVKDRSNPALIGKEVEKAGAGNFSGKPTEKRSNELLALSYKRYKDRFILIGSGGIFTAEDAYKKIKLGATLVQLITGMIYMGPQQIGEINRGIYELLKRDGFSNIGEAVGSAHEK
jgi:dihydroorotate dehydrogenase